MYGKLVLIMEMLTQHIIFEYVVSLIRGKPPSILIIVSLIIILLFFIFLSWRIFQLKWQLSEKQKYIEKLEDDNKHSLKNIETQINQLPDLIEKQLINNMSDRMHIRHENIEPASEKVNLERQKPEVVSTKEISSCLFTAKARNEKKQFAITQALQESFEGRYGKARALADELKRWQRDGYIETNYNAKVVYDELNNLLTNIPVKYAGFRKYY